MEYESEIKRLDEKFDRDNARLKDLESMQKELSSLSARLGAILEHHEAQLTEHNNRIGTLEKVPSKRWDTIVAAVLSGIVGICLVYLLGK